MSLKVLCNEIEENLRWYERFVQQIFVATCNEILINRSFLFYKNIILQFWFCEPRKRSVQSENVLFPKLRKNMNRFLKILSRLYSSISNRLALGPIEVPGAVCGAVGGCR